MSRKHDSSHDYLPKVDDVVEISYLPRDIRIGAKDSKGEYLCGWCETTGTRQLWECIGEGKARFVGYVSASLATR